MVSRKTIPTPTIEKNAGSGDFYENGYTTNPSSREELHPTKRRSLLLCSGFSIEEDMGKKPNDN